MNKGKEIEIYLLSERIEKMRHELLKIGSQEGLTAPSTLRHSRLLDEEIKAYQKMKC
ncbi:Spo0E family sporulation regulatory protein-aspartic acid phosphatase [Gracilibacillus salitolerans]|uniref:Spo0E family sporulation regulatory protein-aspartic acid phosphatase n=1 Tax=Gracilibacillus salitolerans TaxID=2663022 RepID=A0A5Q2TTY6_9BACI|nr:aspartyl-phosphate phosphatase Spo0E family protein [Gracilibacillus salitolerans]QGH36248.1 Spo0E family sporulation regulatory protein-aspartic acid phosphatase [Gracilibacillus salitolerans]